VTESDHRPTPASDAADISVDEFERLRRCQQIARLGYCELPADGGEWHCCELFRALLGVRPGERVSGDLDALLGHVHPADRGAVGEALGRVRSSGEPARLDLRLVSALGDLHYVHLDCCPLPAAPQGAAGGGLFLVACDATDNRTVAMLSQRLRQLLDNSPDEIVAYAADSLRVLQLNASALRNLGYRQEDGERLRCLDLYPDLSAAELDALLAPLYDGSRGQVVLKTRQRRADGGCYPVEARFQLLREPAGAVILASVVDISERSAAAEALQLSEQRYRTIFDNSGAALALVGPGGELELVNEAFAQMIGAPAAVLTSGRQFVDCVAGEDRERVVAHLRRCRQRPLRDSSFSGDGLPGDGLPGDESRRDGAAAQRLEFRFRDVRGKLGWGYLAVAAQPGSDSLVASVIDISQLKRTQASLHYLANHDALTGLPNRSLFRERLRAALERVGRECRFTAVLLIDLDRFKTINDTLDHHWGDELLRVVSGRIAACVRDGDSLARLGGDEFGVILGGLRERRDAGRVAEKILGALSAPVELRGHRLYITASIGIALGPDDADTVDEMMVAADVAMYQAKDGGKNTFNYYASGMNRNSYERLDLESGLRSALERGEFRLVYQPQVDLRDASVCGVEALLRWQPAQRDMVFPDQFVPLLEETGLIIPVGRWVLEQACRQSMEWIGQGLPPLRVAVNLSARQVVAGGLPETVAEVLQLTGLAPQLLELEITESLLMQDVEHTRKVLSEIGALGVGLSIDDFGTGYSSLAYLKRLPVQALKIDRSFVMDMANDSDDAAIVRSTIELGHNLGLEVVAEGLEDRVTMHTLQRMGCDYAQGYHLARPLPADEVGTAVRRLPPAIAPSGGAGAA